MAEPIWYQKTEERQAVLYHCNDQYKYEIYDRWIGRYGTKVPGTLLYSGYRETLEQAKKVVFGLL